MKVLVIQPKIGMGDMVIYLPYIHAISKKYQTPVSILVKENSRANQLLAEDRHIDEIILLDNSSNDDDNTIIDEDNGEIDDSNMIFDLDDETFHDSIETDEEFIKAQKQHEIDQKNRLAAAKKIQSIIS